MDVKQPSTLRKMRNEININEKYYNDFWYWVTERQIIYQRRFVEKKPKPWTDDPILQQYSFTNVYRTLDRGTIYYLENIATLDNPRDRLLSTLAYRYFNHIPTWQKVLEWVEHYYGTPHLVHGQWQWKPIAQMLTRWETEGNKVFTPAFTVTGVRFGGFPDKISNVCWLVEHLQAATPTTLRRIFRSQNFRDVYDACYNLLGFGAFLAFQVAVDLSYSPATFGRTWSRDDYAVPGPGCIVGLNYIFGKINLSYEKQIYYLRDLSDEITGEHIVASDIENCLCEYGKYAKLKWKKRPDGTECRAQGRRYKAT
jgi:alpha-glutamyl/putrescinyl thymine pyrophosphorylase clade 1